jgi:hypothetical protein
MVVPVRGRVNGAHLSCCPGNQSHLDSCARVLNEASNLLRVRMWNNGHLWATLSDSLGFDKLSLHVHLIVIVVGSCARVSVLQLFPISIFALLFS